MIEIAQARKRFGGNVVLDGVNLQIAPGERIALMGPNGAGKTTLVRVVLGFYHLDEGRVRVDGFDPVAQRVEVLRRIAFIPQTPPPIRLLVSELIEYVARSSQIEAERIREEAQALELVVEEHWQKPFFKLSGGMKQKLLIAIALARRGRYFIFDEPTANLDPKARELFYKRLEELSGEHGILFITHRIEELAGLIDRKIYMELGKVVEDEPFAMDCPRGAASRM
ncbi:MAG: ABC transporter ATP-binding protein [Nitratiruptor sp.]|nr:ABC transporter ATP-binding protein [Nitratiruptor sp.]NPA83508.1 ABC transporter ATP-binding protein [Campylobacterota bacterium]